MRTLIWLRVAALILPLAALASLTACGPSFHEPTPPHFVELEDQENHGYDYRAVTADGVVLAVHALDHEPKGDLDFWSDAIENHMRHRAGYALLDEHDVTSKSGLKGRQLLFGHDRGQKPHLYQLTIYLTDKGIYVIEVGGTKEKVEANKAAIDQAVAAFTAS